MANGEQWTVLVYLAGDNNLDSFGLADLREMKQVGSTDHVNVVAQFDRAGSTLSSKRYFLQRGTELRDDAVADLGETNTGDPKILEDFLHWGATTYPAAHYLLVLWNHGAGWDDTNIYRLARRDLGLSVTRRGARADGPEIGATGAISFSHLRALSRHRFRRALFRSTVERAVAARAIAFDDGAQDFLDNLEVKRVLTRFCDATGKKLDVLGMDACLMSMIEVTYQLRGCVGYTVGSEELEPGEGWPYAEILTSLTRRPQQTPEALAKMIVRRYLASYGRGAGVTQSAFDLAKAEELKNVIDRLGRALSRGLADASVRAAIITARAQVQQYDDPPQYVDLSDLCQLIRSGTKQKSVVDACRTVEAAVADGGFVVASGFRGKAVAHSTGVSIYFPTRELSPLYRRLDFAKKASWNEFLARYLTRLRRS